MMRLKWIGYERRAQWLVVALALFAFLAVGARPAHAATITVAKNANGTGVVAVNNGDGKCSLIEAINNANDQTNGRPHPNCAAGNPTGPDTINLPAAADFVLTAAYDPSGPTGLPPIQTTIVISGNGATIRRDANAPFFRLFDMVAPGNLTLEDVRLRGGQLPSGSGGGIRNLGGTLTLTQSELTDNVAPDGGAIYNRSGTVVLTQATIARNTAAGGGGIVNTDSGRLDISTSTFADNEANAGPGGAVWNIANAQLNVNLTTFTQNSAVRGGAITNGSQSTATIARSTLDNNSSQSDGGAITNEANSHLSISDSALLANRAARHGGAIHNETATVAPDVEIVNSTLSYNQAQDGSGGAIHNEVGALSLINVTLSGNTAAYSGGGLAHAAPNVAVIVRSIISGNWAFSGDEVWSNYENRIQSEYSLYGHSGATPAEAYYRFAPSAANNDINASNGGGLVPPANDLNRIIDPNLKRNGGPTKNHTLPFASLAVDWAPSAACAANPVAGADQRGLSRNANGSQSQPVGNRECDLGAVERQVGERVISWWWVSVLKPGWMNLNNTQMDYQPGDVLRYDANSDQWATALDASAAGLRKNVTGLGLLADGSVLLVFAANQAVPGLGTVTPWDVVSFNPATGAWQWALDGSTAGLTTSAEKIDALTTTTDGRLLVSTTGTATVPDAAGRAFKANDEDLIAFMPAAGGGGSWSLYFDGSTVAGLAAEDVVNASLDPVSGDLILGLADNFNVAGITGTNRDLIVIGRGPENTTIVAKAVWNGAAVGFDGVPDALEVR